MRMKNKASKININRQIKQSNNLCEARYKLTTYEQRMVIAICSQIDDRQNELPIIKVKATDLADFCGFDKSKKYTMVKTTARTLRSRTLEYQMSNGDWYITGWINSAFYNSKDSTITFTFDERLKPELLNLKSAYLLTPAEPLMKFDRDYSVRIYFILKKMLKIRDFEKDLDFFRDRFQLGKTYNKISNLKDKVIEPALKEINEKSDISVWHEYIKEGRAYKKIHFIVELKETEKKEIATPASVKKSNKAETVETNDDIINNIDAGNLFSSSDDWDRRNMPAWTPEEYEEPVTSSAVEEEPVDEWSDEQQADYDALIRQDIWVSRAKQIVNTYDHERIKRNLEGVLRDKLKGTISNPPAVIVSAINDDSYNGIAEEKVKVQARAEEKKREEWEKIKNAEDNRKKQIAEDEELRNIRLKYPREKINEVLEEVLQTFDKNNHILTDEMVVKLKNYGLTDRHFMIFKARKSLSHLFKSVDLYS